VTHPAGADPQRTGPRGALPPSFGRRSYRHHVTSLPDGDSAQRPEPEPGTIVCALCGTTAQGAPPTWTYSVENGTGRHYCDRCARENLRAIEGRLDSEWW
jgi:hypothetical protein